MSSPLLRRLPLSLRHLRPPCLTHGDTASAPAAVSFHQSAGLEPQGLVRGGVHARHHRSWQAPGRKPAPSGG